jgi:hypothetical protein
MNLKEQFIVRDVKPLTLSDGKKFTWATGDLNNIVTQYPLKSPDVFKMLVAEEINQSYIGKEFPLIKEREYDYISNLLPEDYQGWYLLGSDCNSAIVVYGEREEILKAADVIENELFSKIGGMQEENFNMGGFDYFIWHLDSGKSLMIVHNDEMYVLPLNDLLKQFNIILVGSGGHADDVLAVEFLTAALIKQLKAKKNKVDDDLSEDFLEYFGEDLTCEDYMLIKGKAVGKKDKDLVLELAYVLCCGLLKQHEATLPDGDDEMSHIEFAKRIKVAYESQVSV